MLSSEQRASPSKSILVKEKAYKSETFYKDYVNIMNGIVARVWNARFGGISLNDQLLQGPDLRIDWWELLQDSAKKQSLSLSGFQWANVTSFVSYGSLKEISLTHNLEEYQMNVHEVEVSPSCSNFTVRRTANGAERFLARKQLMCCFTLTIVIDQKRQKSLPF